jgi:hypothetical protein
VIHTFYGVVKGHEHITPDPKNNPNTSVGLVKLKVQPQAMFADKPTPAQLIVEKSQLVNLPLGAKVRIRMDVYQGEIDLEARPQPESDGSNAQVTISVPGEEPVTTTVEKLDRAVRSGKLRRNRADSIATH